MSFSSNAEAVKEQGWYHKLPGPSVLDASTRQLFEEYCRLEPDHILPHLLTIRERAWAIFPWPCIGMFRFCELSLSKHPSYPRVLAALKDSKQPSTLLDLGCCFGQDIRKLVYDGAPPERLLACDLNSQILDLGYDLFEDRESLKTPMIATDLFVDDGPLAEMEGQLDSVHASLFLHLFGWDRQVEACKRIIGLLKPRSGSMVIGRQTGNVAAHEGYLPTVGHVWRQSDQSFKKMWQEVGQATETDWSVCTELDEGEGEHTEPGFRFLTFEVTRV